MENLANRGYTDGFFQRHESQEMQQYRQGASSADKSQFVAEVVSVDRKTGLVELAVNNKFGVGDRMELATPQGIQQFTLDNLQDLDGNAMQQAPGGGWTVRTTLPDGTDKMGLLARFSQGWTGDPAKAKGPVVTNSKLAPTLHCP